MSTAPGHDHGIRRAIATVCLSGMLEDKLDAAAAAGFDGVEIFEHDLVASSATPAEVRMRCADLGLSIDLYQPFRDFDTVLPDRLTANLRRAEHKFAVMEELGTDTMLVCSSVAGDALDDPARIADQFHVLAERAGRRGIESPTRPSPGAGTSTRGVSRGMSCASAIIRRSGCASTAFTCCHALPNPKRSPPFRRPSRRQDLLPAVGRCAVDEHGRAAVESPPSALPGQGDFDLPLFVDHILTAGYSGPLSLEVFNDIFRQSAPVHTAVDALRSLLVLEESVARRSPPKAETFGLTCPPPVPTLSGHAFVELSAGAGAAAEVADALTSFGFTQRAHTDRAGPSYGSKEMRGFCSTSRSAAAGASEIASLGFDSDRKEQLAARAAAFLATPLPGDGSGMTVTAPDGTILALLRFSRPGNVDVSVRASSGGRLGRDGLTRIDHVALTQPFDYFDEAALFYRAVLGLAPGK